MSKAGRSLFIFGIYAMVSGILLVTIPNVLFTSLGLSTTSDVWPRFAGVLAIVIGFYEMQSGRKSIVDFLWWSIYARASFIIFLAIFALLGLAKPVIILLGVIDLAGAAWTFIALRKAK